MRILYIAEIVGKPGIYCVKTHLARLRKELNIDFVVANGDGATGGFGIGKNHSVYLRKLGVDVITGGDQTFFKKDIADHIDKAPYILRPANLPPEMPGRGWRHFTVNPSEWSQIDNASPADDDGKSVDAPDGGEQRQAGGDETSQSLPRVKVAVVNLIGQSGFTRIHGGNPFTYLANVLERIQKDSVVVIVDFHAMTTAEKYTMFHYLNGKVTAVVGSGQRVQTADAHVMSSGTAVICDAGRTGSQNSVGGMSPGPEIKKYLTKIPVKSEEGWDALELQGVLLDVDPAGGYVTAFEPVREGCPSPEKGREG